MLHRDFWLLCLSAVLIALVSAGCGSSEQITSYSVPKPELLNKSAEASAGSDRMLGAIVPRGSQAWFFKLTGPVDTVDQNVEAFNEFVGSVRFNDQGEPVWSLPEGWQAEGTSKMRFATLKLGPPEKPLALSVTTLTIPAGGVDSYVLDNLNRWRGQLRLSPLTALDVPAESVVINVDGTRGTLVNWVGQLSASGAMPPFASRGAEQAPSPSRPAARRPSEFAFTAPESWAPGRLSSMRKAAFTIGDGANKVEMTVIILAAASNKLLPNINRWRGQVGLEPISAENLADETQELEIGGGPAHFVKLVGPQGAILGAIAYRGEQAWFYKLSGKPEQTELVVGERQRFLDFLQSIRFGDEGVGNGE